MNYYPYLIIFLGSLCFTSCTEEAVFDNRNTPVATCENIDFSLGDIKLFELDSTSSPFPLSINYFEDGAIKLIARLNQRNNSLFIHDYLSGQILKKINWPYEGAESPGRISGLTIYDLDRIFLYSKNRKRISLADSSGKLRNVWVLDQPKPSSNLMAPEPVVSTQQPLVDLGTHLNLIGYINGEYPEDISSNRPVNLRLHKANSTIQYSVGYPDSVYTGHNWFGSLFRHVYYTYNDRTGQFIYSFPADHQVVVLDSDGTTSSYYFGSRHISSIKSTTKHWFTDKEARYDHYATTGSYTTLAYDQYRNIYYRFAQLPLEIEQVGEMPKPIVIVAYDTEFSCLGEFELPHPYFDHNIYFISPEGLHIATAVEAEDALAFQLIIPHVSS